jgi:hypothetical protein
MQAFFPLFGVFNNNSNYRHLNQAGRTVGKGFIFKKLVRGVGALLNIFSIRDSSSGVSFSRNSIDFTQLRSCSIFFGPIMADVSCG